ncbi:GNAT family N-acetyltransferase [Paenibacillus aurantius]|uniref:GNAT family N-acetyltransferase n=1 Tax=Paenibacillus aurantius TaxID=2918900 RepID=A0AA96RKC6_9BACL|nr:GNAT family N-acetyltransferase [Paenibacillus aurantius]
MEANDDSSGYFVMVNAQNEVIGHAGYLLQHSKGRYEIVGVVTCKDWLRRGVGASLIAAICQKAKERGHDEVVLYTLDHERNQAALAFYDRLGFQAVHLEKDYYQPGYHRLTLVKSLETE